MTESFSIPRRLSEETLRLLTTLDMAEIERRLQVKPPAEGEVTELVHWLRENAEDERQMCESSNRAALNLARAAELLQRQADVEPIRLPENPPAHLLPAGCDLDEWGPVVRETWKAARREVERQALQPVPLLPNNAQAIKPAERTLLVPALQPVPVSERLPGLGDCAPWIDDPYEEPWCWIGFVDGDKMAEWHQAPASVLKHYSRWTHWLPHWALPLPEASK